MAAPLAQLDGPLSALVRDLEGVLAPLTARARGERALLAFTDAPAAARHLASLPQGAASRYRIWTARAGDWRAKEELLRAAGTAGATRVDLDPDLELRPSDVLPLATALAYVGSYKRGTACL